MFVISTATPSAPLATNGTLTFSYPSIPLSGLRVDPQPFNAGFIAENAAPMPLEQTSSGDFAYSNQHKAYAAGLQAALKFGQDFSLSFSDTIASGVTFTYLGSTPIPAGTPVTLQLHMVGQNDGAPYVNDSRRGRTALSPVSIVRFGTPLAASTTGILATTAVADVALHTLASAVVLDIPRNLQVVSSTTDTTQVVTVRGLDEYGVAMTEAFTMNGATPVLGKKAFKTVISYQASIALAGNLSIGWSIKMGLPFALPANAYVIAESVDGAVPTRATIVAADNTVPSATTGDVRGTYQPNTTQNAVHRYEAICMIPDPNYLGLPQYAG